jgi:hypothetical protein
VTTKRTFECNLCRATIRETGNIGRGIKWVPGGLAWDTCSQAESHLCDNCVNHLMTLFRGTPSLSPAERP